MNNPELIAYVKEQCAAGYTPAVIRAAAASSGWSAEDVNGAFAELEQKGEAATLPTVAAEPALLRDGVVMAALPLLTQASHIPARPHNIKVFEYLMYASILLQFAGAALAGSGTFLSWMMGVFGIGGVGLLPLLVVLIAARRRSLWARFYAACYVVWNVVSAWNPFLSLLSGVSSGAGASALVSAIATTFLPLIMQVVAIRFAFTREADGWYFPEEAQKKGSETSAWRRRIPHMNKLASLAVFALLAFDTYVLISSPSLWPFYVEIALVSLVFFAFAWYENVTLKRKFENSVSSRDRVLSSMIASRNLAVILNAVPLIQIVGGFVLAVGAIPFLILYASYVGARLRESIPATGAH